MQKRVFLKTIVAAAAAAAAGDHSERAFEFVTIADDAVSAPSETSDSSEKEA